MFSKVSICENNGHCKNRTFLSSHRRNTETPTYMFRYISVAAYTYVSASLTNIQTIGNSVFEKKETREVKRRTEHHTYRNMLITLKRVF